MTGRVGQMQEVILKGVGKNARNSMSMKRIPGSITDNVRGTLNTFQNTL